MALPTRSSWHTKRSHRFDEFVTWKCLTSEITPTRQSGATLNGREQEKKQVMRSQSKGLRTAPATKFAQESDHVDENVIGCNATYRAERL